MSSNVTLQKIDDVRVIYAKCVLEELILHDVRCGENHH